MSDAGEPVSLYAYDLTMGAARQFSPIFLGKQINAVWHTGVVVGGQEYFFGYGIQQTRAGSTPFGRPIRIENLGTTQVPKEVLADMLAELGASKFRPETYNLLFNNCNHFSNELSLLLTGTPIPDDILTQAQEVLNTPMGEMLMPMLMQMEMQTANATATGFSPGMGSSGAGMGPFGGGMGPFGGGSSGAGMGPFGSGMGSFAGGSAGGVMGMGPFGGGLGMGLGGGMGLGTGMGTTGMGASAAGLTPVGGSSPVTTAPAAAPAAAANPTPAYDTPSPATNAAPATNATTQPTANTATPAAMTQPAGATQPTGVTEPVATTQPTAAIQLAGMSLPAAAVSPLGVPNARAEPSNSSASSTEAQLHAGASQVQVGITAPSDLSTAGLSVNSGTTVGAAAGADTAEAESSQQSAVGSELSHGANALVAESARADVASVGNEVEGGAEVDGAVGKNGVSSVADDLHKVNLEAEAR